MLEKESNVVLLFPFFINHLDAATTDDFKIFILAGVQAINELELNKRLKPRPLFVAFWDSDAFFISFFI